MYNNYIQLNLINEFFSGYHAFFCDRNPKLGQVLNFIIGPLTEEKVSTELRKENVKQFKEYVHKEMK